MSMSQDQFRMIAKTLYGLEQMLATELVALGANEIELGRRMVSFVGDKEMMYKANLHLRTALRILKPIYQFKAKKADEIYGHLMKIDWEQYMDLKQTFSVDAVVYSEEFTHSKFVAYRVKDAISDWFTAKYEKRPSVSVTRPDIYFHIHISHDECTLCLDSSGESLHKRGYRVDQLEAPLNEVLAAGLVLLSGWTPDRPLLDPMCGSGTILIEAAMIARGISPGLYRDGFAFEQWRDFDSELFDALYNDDSREQDVAIQLFGSDVSAQAAQIATDNIRSAGLSQYIKIENRNFQSYEEAPAQGGFIITNPPYGERLKPQDLLGLYEMMGSKLKHVFGGYEAWILSYKEDFFEKIALKPSQKIRLMNGALECDFRSFELFNGKYNEFKKEKVARIGYIETDKQGFVVNRKPLARSDDKEGEEEDRPRSKMMSYNPSEGAYRPKARKEAGERRQITNKDYSEPVSFTKEEGDLAKRYKEFKRKGFGADQTFEDRKPKPMARKSSFDRDPTISDRDPRASSFDKSYRDRPAFNRDDRPKFGSDRPDRSSNRSDDRKPYGANSSAGGSDKPYRDRPAFNRDDRPKFGSDRPDRSSNRSDDRKPYGANSSAGGSDRPYRDRPAFNRDDRPKFGSDRPDRSSNRSDDRKPYGANSSAGGSDRPYRDRPAFNRDDRPKFGSDRPDRSSNRSDDRKPYGANSSAGGSDRPYRDRPAFNRDDRPKFSSDRPDRSSNRSDDRKPYRANSSADQGARPLGDKGGYGGRKSFNKPTTAGSGHDLKDSPRIRDNSDKRSYSSGQKRTFGPSRGGSNSGGNSFSKKR